MTRLHTESHFRRFVLALKVLSGDRSPDANNESLNANNISQIRNAIMDLLEVVGNLSLSIKNNTFL